MRLTYRGDCDEIINQGHLTTSEKAGLAAGEGLIMARSSRDWHPEDIKAAIRKSGITLNGLSLESGLTASAVRFTLIRPWPRVQAIIAARLGKLPQDIWPSRYDGAGNPLPRRDVIAAATPVPSQKRKAA